MDGGKKRKKIRKRNFLCAISWQFCEFVSLLWSLILRRVREEICSYIIELTVKNLQSWGPWTWYMNLPNARQTWKVCLVQKSNDNAIQAIQYFGHPFHKIDKRGKIIQMTSQSGAKCRDTFQSQMNITSSQRAHISLATRCLNHRDASAHESRIPSSH